MYASTLLVAALGAVNVLAAPTWPSLNWQAARTDGLSTVSEYFNMLAEKVDAAKLLSAAPVCDLSKASPVIGSLDAPLSGLTLKHVAVGRGTQNYTCDPAGDPSAAPTAAGALATLFNASCVAATYPDLLAALPKLALQFNLTTAPSGTPTTTPTTTGLGPTSLIVTGEHYFRNSTTPFFDLDLNAAYQLGQAPCAKAQSVDAPADAPAGPDGAAAVAWLRLTADAGATGDIQEVYRVATAGGSAPDTCAGMPAAFEVQYAAQYWFFEGKAES
ncbi:hypothetical protein GGR56DRAFT_677997 [Xylariaceae sp. FL0804]|nr:hypothetical protein GGR56DRAFT_677997 [Xylariaceae sp. FL0804]